jgi:hypothetical protein
MARPSRLRVPGIYLDSATRHDGYKKPVNVGEGKPALPSVKLKVNTERHPVGRT